MGDFTDLPIWDNIIEPFSAALDTDCVDTIIGIVAEFDPPTVVANLEQPQRDDLLFGYGFAQGLGTAYNMTVLEVMLRWQADLAALRRKDQASG